MKQKSRITRHAQVVLATGLLIVSCLATLAQTTNSFFEFVQAQSQRQYTKVPREVLAAYYVWYGRPGREGWEKVNREKREIANTPQYPVHGPYSSHDPTVIDSHIDLAKANGITGFAVSWWGTGEWESWVEQAFPLLLERAAKKDFKIAIYWEQAPGEGQFQIDRAVGELSYALLRHGKSQAYLRVDGKPVIVGYNRVLHQVPLESWPEIIRRTRAQAGDFVLVMDGYLETCANLFDGVHLYTFADKIPSLNPDELRVWATHHYSTAVQLARQHGRISCVTVIPGHDITKVHQGGGFKVERRDGQAYRILWEEAIKSKPDWVLITSWNEWYEGSEIEPSMEFGDKYAKLTGEFAPRFVASPPIAITASKSPPRLAPGTTQALGNLLAGRTIGVLPDCAFDPQFWLVYCGATVRQLTWTNLIDARLFNAKNFPFVIHAAGETYRSSVKTTDDVIHSLVRYLREGGLLVSLPSEPWPFYYDSSRNHIPFAITDKLAMGIDSEYGFDQPSGGMKLTFHARTNVLLGLPASVPFPQTGDRRWRPINRTRVPAADIYVPLVQLQDGGGTAQGDAAAYIEHRTGSLYSGKSIHVWMRTAESFGPDIFTPSLYQFISTRLKPLPSENP